MESFKEYLNKNRGALLGCAVGVVCAVLFLTIGFFPTLLIAVMGGLGALIGFNKNIRRWFGHFSPPCSEETMMTMIFRVAI